MGGNEGHVRGLLVIIGVFAAHYPKKVKELHNLRIASVLSDLSPGCRAGGSDLV